MRLTTGVPGFDEMIGGGLPVNASVVLQGPPGQEKMRFALTFLAEGLKSGASGLIAISSQSPDSVLTELRNLGVDLDAVVQENRLRIVDWYTQREEPVQDVEELGIGSGLSEAELGLRLRYEIVREIAPYLGVSWERKIGPTADVARRAETDVGDLTFVTGVRFWF